MAAYLAAAGSSLAAMAFRFTSGEKFAAVEADMARRTEQLERLRVVALELVDRDSAAYDRVTASYKSPKVSEAEKQARSAGIQAALTEAMAVPRETMSVAVQALRLCAEGSAAINPNLASDCATASWCLWGAVESAFLNVRINAAGIKDAGLVGRTLDDCRRMQAEARTLAEGTRSAIERHLA